MKIKNKIEDISWTLYEIPFFLDAKDIYQWTLWKQLLRCNRVIRKLMVNEVLPDEEINDIFLEFNEKYKKINTNDFEMEIIVYFDTVIDYLLHNAIDCEFYEAAANLQKYNKKFTTDEN